MSRIAECFKQLNQRTALVTFITAGDPSPEHTVPALHAMVAGGADILELGVPFSDPEAEGPSIQASSERALSNGMNLSTVLDMVAEFRKQNAATPIILMGYLNSLLAMPDFAPRAQAAGVDGVIMVNMPPEEAQPIQRELAAHDLDVVYLLAPTTTDERARLILSRATGFAYYVSLKGITGASHLDVGAVAQRVATLKTFSDLPICVGFGIKDAQTAAAVGDHADGVVVGSALVNLLASHPEDIAVGCAAMQEATAMLRAGLDRMG